MQGSLPFRGFLFLVLFLFTQVVGADDPVDPILSADLWFGPEEFAEGQLEDAVAGHLGLTMAENASGAVYTSPAFEAPIAFNALVPQWQADLPTDEILEHALEFEFRTAKSDGEAWSEWLPLHANHDNMTPEDTMIIGDMLVVPAADVTHRMVQYRVTMAQAQDAQEPILERLRITFIDSTAGPTTAELLAQQPQSSSPQEGEGGFPKPPVIPRSGPGGWCTDPECNYSDGLEYEPVTHLILHHTVTSSNGDSAATVRAIWQFHTFTREWGDIGYNYLVDVNGVIFEGHLGGDDVIGTHAAGANAGSMAASLIGNFVDVTPPQAMLNATADLFAWKADQKNIDIYDSGSLPDMEWGLPKLMGHRDVYGTTQCPGDKAHVLLPTLREMIAERIDFTPPHLYYDELDPDTNFSRSGDGWLNGPRACGFNTHAYYVLSTTDGGASHSAATWRPRVDVPGRYELYVYAPYCYTQRRDTNGAVFRVTDPLGTSTVVVNQEENLGHWVSIGTYTFEGTSTSISLSNLTSTDNDWGVWFDAIRLRYLEPGALNRQPAESAWLRSRTVRFEWSVTNVPNVTQQRLQLARDPTFSDPIFTQVLSPGARSYTHTFDEEQPRLYWRIVLTRSNGQLLHSASTSFGVDTQAPVSSAFAVLRFPDDRLMVAWQGEDDGAGISGYNIDYRAEGSASWTRWQENTEATLATFDPPQPGTTYWFRSQAIDKSGLAEPLHAGNGDSNTAQARFMDERSWFPLIYR